MVFKNKDKKKFQGELYGFRLSRGTRPALYPPFGSGVHDSLPNISTCVLWIWRKHFYMFPGSSRGDSVR